MHHRLDWEIAIRELDGADSPHTLRSYRCDFERFENWCKANSLVALPASPSTIARFIAEQYPDLKPTSLKRRLVGIRKIHRLFDFEDPTGSEIIETEIRRARRRYFARPRQALGLTQQLRDRLVAACDDTLLGLRNRTMIAVGYDTLCRRSELVGLRVEDITRKERGASIIVRRSKNDPFGSGRTAAISSGSLRILDQWLDAADIENGIILRPVYKGVV